MKKLLSLFCTVSAACGLLLGAAQAQSQEVMRVTDTSCVCFLPTNLAIKRGWLAEELKQVGLALKTQKYEDGPSQTAALLSGSLDLAQYGSTGAVSLLARGADIKIFMLSDNEVGTEGLVTRKGAGIKSIKDLAGKKVGVTFGTTSDYGLRAALKEAGVDVKSVKMVGLAPPAIGAAWARGDIDASYVWDPILTKLGNSGGDVIQTIGDLAKATSGKYKIVNFYVASGPFAKKHPEAIKAYVKAIDRATQFIRGNAAEVAKEFQSDLGAASVEQAMQQIKGEEFFLSSEQRSAQLMGDGSAPGALVKVMMDVWQFSFDNRNVTAKPDNAVVTKAFDVQYLK